MRRKMTDTMLLWKKEEKKSPLIITGTRQTGKTWLLQDFGKRYYRYQAYFHLETDMALQAYFSREKEPSRLLEFLEAHSHTPILPGNTLIILDELQTCPAAWEALGGFAAEFPEYAIVGAQRTPGPFVLPPLAPADAQVEELNVMSFEEFLWACREVSLAKEIREHFQNGEALEKKLHQQALHLFRIYLITGGFPAAVKTYREEHSLLGIPDIHSKIRQMDLEDIAAGISRKNRNAARSSYSTLPRQLQKENPCFQYRVASKGSTRSTMSEGIRWITQNGLVLEVKEWTSGENDSYSCQNLKYESTEQLLPKEQVQEPSSHRFRLYARDAGLCATGMGIAPSSLLQLERSRSIHRAVENCLAVTFSISGYKMSYWSSGNKALLPFILDKNGEQIAVDVHFEENKKSRSLFEYQKHYRPDRAYRISELGFKQHEHYYQIPYYAAFCI